MGAGRQADLRGVDHRSPEWKLQRLELGGRSEAIWTGREIAFKNKGGKAPASQSQEWSILSLGGVVTGTQALGQDNRRAARWGWGWQGNFLATARSPAALCSLSRTDK